MIRDLYRVNKLNCQQSVSDLDCTVVAIAYHQIIDTHHRQTYSAAQWHRIR